MNEQDRIYREARKKVRRKRKFYSHFSTWAVMSIFFILLNLFTSRHFWAIFPILGWGIGLALHGIKVFSITIADDWEDREIEKEIERAHRRREMRESGYFENDHEGYSTKHSRWNDSDFV